MFQTRGKECFSVAWKARMLNGVKDGVILLRPTSRDSVTLWFPGHWKKAWRRVSFSSSLHLLHFGDWFGRILAVRSAVGRMLWRSLKRKLVRLGPSILCLASCQVLSQDTAGAALSILNGFRDCLPASSVMVKSSIRNL